ncbi:thioredoxin family protein [Falsochrobactrum sp. TDYN1]|uniref:Thioredoxin family protein n=1 Tax=Falsochrobactrum tianjinense TaxID=2706015 RepID=A0A949PK30_9HYPH|nr:thioredoxin family protein [Falsochrobactrum sp. TDYN1]
MGLAFTGSLSMTGTAQAQDGSNRTAVLELYTSQGCKSCPQADRNLAGYADDPNVLALSFHVNYWDYMGWRDTLATQEATDRQNAYRNSFNTKMVYTPQVIVNGATEMNGGDTAAINEHLAAAKLNVPVSIQRSDDGRLSIEIAAGKKPQMPVHVVLFYLRDSVTIPITKGENAGQSLTYRNTVSDINTIGMWDGEAMKIELPVSELDRKDVTGCAIVLQEYRSDNSLGPILGSALFTEKGQEGL